MKKIGPIAFLVIKAELRRKIIYFSIFFACLIIFASKSFTSITPGAEKKFVLDMSYTWINLIGVIIVVITATGVVSAEEKDRTDYYYRTNPVSDTELILGKFVGAAGIVLLAVTIMQIFYFVFFWINFHQFSIEQIKAFILMDFALIMLTSIGIFSSCLFSRFVSMLVCLLIYFMGILSSCTIHFAESQHEEVHGFADKLSLFVFKHLPNFEKFNVTEPLILGWPIKQKIFWSIVLYGVSVTAVIMIVTIVLWKLKNRLK